MLSPLLFNIYFAAVIIVVLQRFAADPEIVSDFVCHDNAPKGEGCRPRLDGALEMVRGVEWRMLYADNAGGALTSPRGFARMIDVSVVVYQEFGVTVSEKTEAMSLWFNHSTASNALQLRRQVIAKTRQPSLCTLVVLSARARTLTPRLSVASASLGRVSEYAVHNCTTDGTPGCRSRLGYSKRR